MLFNSGSIQEENNRWSCIRSRIKLSLFATIDGVAKLNDKIISTSQAEELSKSLVFTGLNQREKNKISPTFDALKELALNTQKVRITGSCALDLCYVAADKTDAYVEYGVYLWDYAAGALIAEKSEPLFYYIPMKKPQQELELCAQLPKLQILLKRYGDQDLQAYKNKFDIYELYEASVQNVITDLNFGTRVFKNITLKPRQLFAKIFVARLNWQLIGF